MSNIKKTRRWRDKSGITGISSIHKDGRIHDYLKGWGTTCKDGSILWDHWRPLTKRQSAKNEARQRRARRVRLKKIKNGENPDAWIFPIVVNAITPELIMSDIVNVQPMNADILDGFFEVKDQSDK